MAESSSGSKGFAKVFQKKVIRAKEKVLQNLGKTDKTTDGSFDDHVSDFNRQQAVACKLQKELKNYTTHMKAASLASKAFYDAVKETYEEEWTGQSELVGATEALSDLWRDYNDNLTGHLQEPLAAYISKFPDVKAKIAKRNRKMVDYDSARHNLDTLEGAKKRDDNKIGKGREDLHEARRIYEEINTELHRELPVMYEGRKSFLSSHFNALFCAEGRFQEESAKIKANLADATARLQKESADVFFRQNPQLNSTSDSDEARSKTSEHSPGLSKFYNINIPNDVDKTSDTDRLSAKDSAGGSDSQPEPSPASDRRKEFVTFPTHVNGVNGMSHGTKDKSRTESGSSNDYQIPASTRDDAYEPFEAKPPTPPPPQNEPQAFEPPTPPPPLNEPQTIVLPDVEDDEPPSPPHSPPPQSNIYEPIMVTAELASPVSEIHSSLTETAPSPTETAPSPTETAPSPTETAPLRSPTETAPSANAMAPSSPAVEEPPETHVEEEDVKQKRDSEVTKKDKSTEQQQQEEEEEEEEERERDGLRTKKSTSSSREVTTESVYEVASATDDIYRVPTSNLPVGNQATVLFRVEATHNYAGEDMDELTFECGETIKVVPYDDPEEQDDGWQMGVKEATGDKGVFPENFTKRI